MKSTILNMRKHVFPPGMTVVSYGWEKPESRVLDDGVSESCDVGRKM